MTEFLPNTRAIPSSNDQTLQVSTALSPPASSRRQFLGHALLAALGSSAVLGAATGWDGARIAEAAPRLSTTRISMVGDSLTYGSLRYQAEALNAVGWAGSAIDGYGSRGIRTKIAADAHTGLTAVDAIRWTSGDSDFWIVALGTNDCGIYSAAKYPEVIAKMLDHIGDGHHVMWVNVYLPKAGARQNGWNDALTAVARDRPEQLQIFDWATLAERNPAWIAKDNIHCTAAGYQARSMLVANATMLARAVESRATRFEVRSVR